MQGPAVNRNPPFLFAWLISVLLLTFIAPEAQALPSYFKVINSGIASQTAPGGQGIAWIDYDNDGLQDLFIPNGSAGGQSQLYHNNGNFSFTNVSGNLPASLASFESVGAAVGDYDGDGWDDIFVTTDAGFSNVLLRNNGDGTFSDTTGIANLSNEIKRSMSAAFGDVNGDGWLDLYVSNNSINTAICKIGDQDNRNLNDLYINNRDGKTFTRRNDLGGSDYGCTWVSALTDYDNDGDLDIFVVNDTFGVPGSVFRPSEIYRNNLVENGSASFTPIGFSVSIAGMGIAIGDYDNDQDLDYFQTDLNQGSLSTNSNGVLSTNQISEDTPFIGWGAVFLDADNDGFLDLYSAKSGCGFGRGANINSFLINDGVGGFTQESDTVDGFLAGLSHGGMTKGVAVADVNNNGRMDIVTHGCDGEVNLYKNTTFFGNWLQVRLVGNNPNHRGIGAKVSLTLADGKTLLREVHAGTSLSSTNATTVHFGLANNTTITALTVEWPNGCVQASTNLSANQILPVLQTSCAGFTVSYLQPTAGVAGETIAIYGQNLAGITDVRFNGISADILGVFDTVVVITVPVGATVGANTITFNGSPIPGSFNVISSVGNISGKVTDSSNGNPVEGVQVLAMQNGGVSVSAITDAFGDYSMVVPNGNYLVMSIKRFGYVGEAFGGNSWCGSAPFFDAVYANSVTANCLLDPDPGFLALSGTVKRSDGSPLPGIDVKVINGSGTINLTVATGLDGKYSFSLPNGGYIVKPLTAGYSYSPGQQWLLMSGQNQAVDFVASP